MSLLEPAQTEGKAIKTEAEPIADPLRERPLRVFNPLGGGTVVLVTAVGEAEGSRGAAAALTCAGAELDVATLLVDVGGRLPRPTLLASAAAQAMEERLVAHLPKLRVAARGQVCHLAVSADTDGLAAATAAATINRETLTVIHLPPELLPFVTSGDGGPRLSGVLLRSNLRVDRALVALAARDLLARRIAVGVLKQRLSWVAERRALFGALPAGAPGGLPERLVRRLIGPAV